MLDCSRRAILREVEALGRSKIAALFISILILSLGASSCTSQGPREQQRPSESQKPATEATTQPALENPAPTMEQTAAREESTQSRNP
jgi:PBP1b-binding outer membrane lipoprotein LpoB